MAEKKLNFIVTVVLLTLTACSVLFISSARKTSIINGRLLNFPMKLGNWSGKILPMDARVYQILGTDKVLFREYVNPQNEKVWFCIVYGEQNRQSFHPPEYCYLGGGNAELLDKGKVALRLNEKRIINVNKLLFQIGKYKQLVLYWFTAGNKMTENYYKQQIYFVLDEIKYHKSSGT
ncbi:MAG: EpsI family protein, partial [Candidatus Omnitrophica bacterium]|nr:EpsI family protein [Candidatus Omnitrophota bacterium]